ncbi:MAG TPA: FIST N-terminal domain-containing protein [Acidimicrobiales bacterium]|nr:FIST N-terminal domain-containing protein [Acidimicrobiales bacterium]
MTGDDPKLLVVFASDIYELTRLLDGVADVAGDVPVIGCSTAGEIAAAGPGTSGVVVMALGGAGFSVATAAADADAHGLRQAGADVAASVARLDDRPHKVMLLLSDGLGGDQQEVVRGAHRVLGAEVPLVGGCAGDDLKMQHTFQFHGRSVMEHAVVGAAIGSCGPIGIGVEHGWRAVGEPMVVTASDGNRVLALDDQPALSAYLQRLDAPASLRGDAEAFTRFAMTHPLGLSRRSGDEVRFVAGADFAEQSLNCIAALPQGSLAWIMEGNRDSVLEATNVACQSALAELDGRPPVGLLAFDCIARKGVLGDGIVAEVDQISGFAAGAPVAGFYTYGEIARTRGVNGFHNQTLVVVAFG